MAQHLGVNVLAAGKQRHQSRHLPALGVRGKTVVQAPEACRVEDMIMAPDTPGSARSTAPAAAVERH